jgi:hypothetical protein
VLSNDSAIRRSAVHKLAILYAARAELGSLNHIVDRNHPRPFKQARPQSTFIPTDIGSARWVRIDHPDEHQDRMPSDLRKRLNDIGWEHEDTILDQRLERARTPMKVSVFRWTDRICLMIVWIAAAT